jgi:hypothetical protein
MNQAGFLFDARTNLGFCHKFIIQIDRRSHAYEHAFPICISQSGGSESADGRMDVPAFEIDVSARRRIGVGGSRIAVWA